MPAASFGLGRSGWTPAPRSEDTQPQTPQPQQHAQPSTVGVPALHMDSSTPWLAIADGNLSLLQSSLQSLNLPVTVADENGYTLLQAAASYSHLPILEWLVGQISVPATSTAPMKSAMINAVDNEGDSALHYASTKEAAEFLIYCGINVDIRNAEGLTALESKQAEIRETLMLEAEEDDDDGEKDGEDDEELASLKEVAAYLSSLNIVSQGETC